MQIDSLEKAILFTISYFDAFDQPLTRLETWNYLFRYKASFDQIIIELDRMVENKVLETLNGFYFLPERKSLVELRTERLDVSERYWRKAIRATRILSYCPFIKTIAANNSLSLFTCDKESDIDFLIITVKGKIWTARALSSALLHLLGVRRWGKRIAGKVCLSMYVAEDKLDLSHIAPREREFFLSYWIAQNAPILDKNGTFKKYKGANDWIKSDLPNAKNIITDYFINFRCSWTSKIISAILELFFAFNFWEISARYIQKIVIGWTQKKLGYPKSVIYNDHILKFHTQDWKRVADIDWERY